MKKLLDIGFVLLAILFIFLVIPLVIIFNSHDEMKQI